MARHFCVWTGPDTIGLVQDGRGEKRRTFPDEKEDFCRAAGVGDAARRIARDGICGGGQRRQAGRDETAWQCENFDAMAELFTAPYRLADGTRNGVN